MDFQDMCIGGAMLLVIIVLSVVQVKTRANINRTLIRDELSRVTIVKK